MKKLFKTTIVIWSEFNPNEEGLEIDALAHDAMEGESYCSKSETDLIENPEQDKDWDGTEFFGEPEEEENEE